MYKLFVCFGFLMNTLAFVINAYSAFICCVEFTKENAFGYLIKMAVNLLCMMIIIFTYKAYKKSKASLENQYTSDTENLKFVSLTKGNSIDF